MKVLHVSVLSCLALAAGMRVYNQHAEQESANSLRQYRAA
jgi:hypothetical protein